VFLATLDAYRREDWARLSELYASDVAWRAIDAEQSCADRAEVFEMFRRNMAAGLRLTFDEIRGVGANVIVTARANGSPPMTSVFHVQNSQIVAVQDYPQKTDAESSVLGDDQG
jgi:ketosteroid isomerase-like protein